MRSLTATNEPPVAAPRGPRLHRVGRWVVPATLISLAVVAVGSLVAGELEVDGPRPPHVAPQSPLAAPGACPPVLAPPGPARMSALVTPSVPRPAPAIPRRGGPATPAAGPGADPFAGAPTLEARLAAVDRLAALPAEQAEAALEGLLGRALPGDAYEVASLRVCVLARLGALPGPRAEGILVACLDPRRPRPERLIALEMLAARPAAQRAPVAAIAERDHDVVVQEKARWALRNAR